MKREEARALIALAADLPLPEAERLYEQVASHVGVVKVGLSLFVEQGPAAVRAFTGRGAKVFLDLKLHDIPNTVKLAASRAGELGVAYLTVHAQGGAAMLEAAVAGAREGAAKRNRAPPKILAVTVLTSHSEAEWAQLGHAESTAVAARRLAGYAERAGVDGLVCSPLEAQALRAALKKPLILCTPGIRPAGAAKGDQSRAATATLAVQAGSDLLVIGRPIYAAADPLAAAQAFCDEVAAAR